MGDWNGGAGIPLYVKGCVRACGCQPIGPMVYKRAHVSPLIFFLSFQVVRPLRRRRQLQRLSRLWYGPVSVATMSPSQESRRASPIVLKRQPHARSHTRKGGWTKPAIKQYRGTTSFCGAGIDENWCVAVAQPWLSVVDEPDLGRGTRRGGLLVSDGSLHQCPGTRAAP